MMLLPLDGQEGALQHTPFTSRTALNVDVDFFRTQSLVVFADFGFR